MTDVKLGNNTYEGVQEVMMDTPDGGTARFVEPDKNVYVQTVNGNAPDETGNVEISIPNTESVLEQAKKYTDSKQAATLEQAKKYTDSKQFGSGASTDQGETVVDVQELVANGATVYGNIYKLVKVSDYLPFGDWVYNIEVASSSGEYKYLSSMYQSSGDDKYMSFGEPVDIPCSFLYVGKNGVSTAYDTWGITEPGLYARPGLYYVKLPNLGSYVDWDTIYSRPFGTFDGYVLRCVDYDRDGEDASKTTVIDGVSTDIKYKRFGSVPTYMTMTDFIGCEMLLSDGSVVTLTEDNFKHIQSEDHQGSVRDVYEIENLLLVTDMNFYASFDVDDTTTISVGRVGGVFTSNYTGAYVKELRCKPYDKTLDSKYLPLTQSDMTETDPSNPGYIKNNILRVSGSNKETVYSGSIADLSGLEIAAGRTYIVQIDGNEAEYETTARVYPEFGVVYIGDVGLLINYAPTEGSSTPFCVVSDGTFVAALLVNPETGEFLGNDTVITISGIVRTHKIDQKYIPAMDSLTLIGADGKQYKITVGENGLLAVTVIE